MQFDRQKFFDNYHASFGALNQAEVDGLNELLEFIEIDPFIKPNSAGLNNIAYMLATIKHETHNPRTAVTFHPIDEIGSATYFNNRYGPHTDVGKNLGNTIPGDGAKYHGRGYVQLTGKKNYAKAQNIFGIDLINEPDRAKEPSLAYRILTVGMRDGWFTSHRIGDYINDHKTDFVEARRVINGIDQAHTIANYAKLFDHILSSSFVPANESTKTDAPVSPHPSVSSNDAASTGELVSVGSDSPTELIAKADTTTVICKERPSIFMRWKTAILTGIGTLTAIGINPQLIWDKLTDKVTSAADNLNNNQVYYLIFGFALIALTMYFYDRAAERSTRLNLQKMNIAADDQKTNVELKTQG